MELATLERLKKSPRHKMGEICVSTFLIVCNEDIHKSLDQIRILTTELAAIERLKIDFSTFSWLLLIRSFIKLAGNEELDEFEFRPDRTTDYGVSCP